MREFDGIAVGVSRVACNPGDLLLEACGRKPQERRLGDPARPVDYLLDSIGQRVERGTVVSRLALGGEPLDRTAKQRYFALQLRERMLGMMSRSGGWTKLFHGGEVPDEYSERAVYVATGEVEIDGQLLAAGRMAVLSPGGAVAVRATRPSMVMLLGGEPIGERFVEWNFVSASRERIEQAKADWRAGRMALPQADHAEFIPLPPDPVPPASPMS